MFTAANPHAKSPAQIQECCLNPGLDTATSPAHPSSCSSGGGSRDRGTWGEDKALSGGHHQDRCGAGGQRGALCPCAPSSPGRAVGPISPGPRGNLWGWDGREQRSGELPAAESPGGLGGAGKPQPSSEGTLSGGTELQLTLCSPWGAHIQHPHRLVTPRPRPLFPHCPFTASAPIAALRVPWAQPP